MLFFYKTLRLKPDLKDLSEEVAFEKWLEATEKLKTKIKEKMSSRENSSFKAPEEEKKKKKCSTCLSNNLRGNDSQAGMKWDRGNG